MNRRQRQRKLNRRRDHERETHGRPHLVLNRKSYSEVKSGHIVPRVYQQAWAVRGQVAVHVDGAERCVLMSTRDAGTRARFYRRVRPTGEQIDDVEASLSVVEDKAKQPLEDLIAGAALDHELKGGLAQFFAVQMVRGPRFFERRAGIVRDTLEAAGSEAFKPEALAAFDGEVEVATERAIAGFADPTMRFRTMLAYGIKIGTILAHMRWQVLRFRKPLVAYSDHPVVLWPLLVSAALPFDRPELGPLNALEIRIPLAPDSALLATWVDLEESSRVNAPPLAAAELNAFTIGQSERQWMHTPGHEPPVADGPLLPLTRMFEPRYDVAAALRSDRRARAAAWIAANAHREFVDGVDVVLVDG
jgi:hypothetical protein